MMKYWGKAERGASLDRPFHRLVFHSLDVAAVTDRLLRRMPWISTSLVRLLGLSDDEHEGS